MRLITRVYGIHILNYRAYLLAPIARCRCVAQEWVLGTKNMHSFVHVSGHRLYLHAHMFIYTITCARQVTVRKCLLETLCMTKCTKSRTGGEIVVHDFA